MNTIMDSGLLIELVKETNKIEGILRPPRTAEVLELDRFLRLSYVCVEELIAFVKVFEPTARLRLQSGMDVRVGTHFPPPGGQHIAYQLDGLLGKINEDVLTPYQAHIHYETLHPFSDGNGRSGRALWAWHMTRIGREGWLNLGFLHSFYYESLEGSQEETPYF